MIITSQFGYNIAGPSHKAMPWQHPTQSLKMFLNGIMANATLCPILNHFYTVLLLICFFALKIKIIPHKQNLPKIS